MSLSANTERMFIIDMEKRILGREKTCSPWNENWI